jgi:hypothetical protein
MLLSIAIACAGCNGDAASGLMAPVDIVDNMIWQAVPSEEDPYWPLEGAIPCTSDDYHPEMEFGDSWFTVETDDCNYLSAEQALEFAVPKGALIAIRIFHFQITKGDGGFNLAFHMGSDAVWSGAVPVPSTSNVIRAEWFTERDYAQGERLLWHVDNHGANAYSLVELTAAFPTQ